jgi:hypothetical protein
MNARYYAPALTRFISADPIVSNIYAPQTLNRYAYALNDPVTFTDPSGKCVVYDDANGEFGKGLDCRTPQEMERDWQREQGVQQREEFRQMRDWGPLRSSQLFTPGPQLFTPGPLRSSQLFTPGPSSPTSAPAAPTSGEPSGNQSQGFQISGNAALCVLLCFGLIDVDLGLWTVHT